MVQKRNQGAPVRVADWMTEGVLAVETFDSIAIARQLMAEHRVNQLPVVDDDHLVGIVTDRDIRDAYPTSMMINRAKEIDRFAAKITVEEVMTHDIFVVRPDTALKTAVGLLRRHRIGALPVVQNKHLVGIIARSDILDFVLNDGAGLAAKVGRKKRSRPAARKKRQSRRAGEKK